MKKMMMVLSVILLIINWGCSKTPETPKSGQSGMPMSETPGMSSANQAIPHTITDAEVGIDTSCAVRKVPVKVTKTTPALDYKGKTYYFCCSPCIDKFTAEPDKYSGQPEK